MKRLLALAVATGVLAILYSTLSDPLRRENLLNTIENSTGVNLESEPDKVLEDTGRALGRASGKILKELGDTLTDPEFHRALKKLGKGALEKLDDVDIQSLKEDLHIQSENKEIDYDAILEKHLGSAP